MRQPDDTDDQPQPACLRCGDSGSIVVRASDLSYVGPGAPPEHAKGYAQASCYECDARVTTAKAEAR